MGNTRARRKRKPGGGRKPSKPEYSAAKNLTQQMKAATDLYTDKMSLASHCRRPVPQPHQGSEAAHHSRGLRVGHGKARPTDL